jgi:outer membrane protein assembly factor BamE
MKKVSIIGLILISASLSACSLFHPYQPDIQQGNLYTSAKVEQIKPGMTKEEVVRILGNPILVNLFNGNHWAYVYTFQNRGNEIYKKRLDIYFRNGVVSRIT